jgi:bacillaene synthase trans-acting acyltransferase
MCSGLGSQYYLMGKDLYDAEPVFRRAMDACSEILQPMIGVSLSELLYRPRADRFAPFDRTLYSSPSICCLQYAVARLLRARGCEPDRVLGYSLGEVSAAMIAGVLSLEEGLRTAVHLAQLLETDAPEGGMLAVLATPGMVRQRPELFAGTWITAYNFPTHFVLSGAPAAIGRVERSLGGDRVSYQRLPVRYAFHSPLIDSVGAALRQYLATLAYGPPGVELISTAGAGAGLDSSPAGLWSVVRQPLDFVRTIEAIERQGPHTYVDLGPSGTLATFVKYNLPADSQSQIASTVTPFGRAVSNLECELFRPVRRQGASQGVPCP